MSARTVRPQDLWCWNPITQKADGSWCVWEGGGKCLKCQAADRIADLERSRDAWEEDAKRYSVNADYWRERAENAERQPNRRVND